MSNSAYVPPGWYPDPSGAAQSRWWDGTQWHEATQPTQQTAAPFAAEPQSYAALGSGATGYTPFGANQYATTPYSPMSQSTVPYGAAYDTMGVDTNTVHIWILVAMPLLSLVPYFFFDFGAYMRASMDPATAATAMFSPSYLALLAGSWGTYLVTALFAFLDWRALKQRIDRPFHFAWVFLYSPIYMIGRPIVARRRAGGGLGVIWAYIASVVLATIIGSAILFSQMASVFSDPTLFYPQ